MIFNLDEKEEPIAIKKEKEPLKTNEPSLIYDSKYSFSEYRNVGKYNLSVTTKYTLHLFYHRLNDFRNFVSQTKKNKI